MQNVYEACFHTIIQIDFVRIICVFKVNDAIKYFFLNLKFIKIRSVFNFFAFSAFNMLWLRLEKRKNWLQWDYVLKIIFWNSILIPSRMSFGRMYSILYENLFILYLNSFACIQILKKMFHVGKTKCNWTIFFFSFVGSNFIFKIYIKSKTKTNRFNPRWWSKLQLKMRDYYNRSEHCPMYTY